MEAGDTLVPPQTILTQTLIDNDMPSPLVIRHAQEIQLLLNRVRAIATHSVAPGSGRPTTNGTYCTPEGRS